MRVWTIANQKGGVGKTTTTVALGSLLASQGKRVLMLDLDPQGSLGSYFSHRPEDTGQSSYDWFLPADQLSDERLMQTIVATQDKNLSLVPAALHWQRWSAVPFHRRGWGWRFPGRCPGSGRSLIMC